MESLLCNEVLPVSPDHPDHDKSHEYANELMRNASNHGCAISSSSFNFDTLGEDFERAFANFVGKETTYMPQRGYSKLAQSNTWIDSVRFRAIHWLIRSERRLNISLETVFSAANYLDRFIALKQCQDWKHWMLELLGIACLSVASKFNETVSLSLHDIQMEGLEHSFESSLIQRMELILLKALEWRLAPATSYSYVELLLTRPCTTTNYSLDLLLVDKLTQLLTSALLDSKFLVFRPCVIALSALQHVSKESSSSTNYAYFSALVPREGKDDLNKCYKMMGQLCNFSTTDLGISVNFNCPSSPVTVLAATEPLHDFSDFHVDLSLLLNMRMPVNLDFGSTKKRKRKNKNIVSEVQRRFCS